VSAGCPNAMDPGEAAAKCASFALDMVAATEDFVSSHGHRIKIRVGLHSGPIVASIVGECDTRRKNA
jgi:class 3 adenylate cyclase